MESQQLNLRKYLFIKIFSLILNISFIQIHFSISSLSKISISCPNMATWYSYIKSNVNEYSTLTSSASALSELGTVIGNYLLYY